MSHYEEIESLTLARVNPLYYVTFTTATLCASFILFKGFNTTNATNTISLLCGFLIIFSGVYLLNLSREDPDGHQLLSEGKFEDAVPTDGIAGLQTRRSMQIRRSIDHHRRVSSGSTPFPRMSSDRERLMHGYDVEEGHHGFALGDLAEDSAEEDEEEAGTPRKRTSFDDGQIRETGAGAGLSAGVKSNAWKNT